MTMSDRRAGRMPDAPAAADPSPEAETIAQDGWGVAAKRKRRRARRRARNLAETLAPASGDGGEALALARVEPRPPAIPQAAADPASERETRIGEVRRGLARRRRRRMAMLLLRLAIFVLLPTAVAGYYFFVTATPMYETRAEFVIQKSEGSGGPGSGLGGLLSGFGLADAKDSIAVQGYLTSQSAMIRLEEEHGFVAHFTDPGIDPLQRLSPDATRAEAYALYGRHVSVGFDLTEGILRMSVIAADPETSARYSEALISYAEEMVDSLSSRARAENMKGAEKSFEAREADVRAAAERVLDLQERYDTFSAEGELQIDMSVIQAQELELEQLRRERNELLSNARPNEARLAVLERDIAFIEGSIDRRRAALTASGEKVSLARISSLLKMAQSDLAAKEQMRVMALNTLEQARIEAARQVRYLSVNVPPVAPDVATHPRRLENTAIAFFTCLGLYLMISLTLSILREQVSV